MPYTLKSFRLRFRTKLCESKRAVCTIKTKAAVKQNETPNRVWNKLLMIAECIFAWRIIYPQQTDSNTAEPLEREGEKRRRGWGCGRGRKRNRLRGVNEMEKNVPAFWVRLRYLLQKEVGGKVCERERETLTSNPPSLWLCLYSAGRKITRAHTCFNTLSAEGIEKRDTLNIKALVNTGEESVLLFSCACMCASMLFAHVKGLRPSTLVQQKFLGCSRNAHQIQHASLNHKKKRRKMGRGEDEIVLQKDLSCCFHLCVCVSLYFTEA